MRKMNINYEINKQKIIDDYYLCMGSFINCSVIYGLKELYTINHGDSSKKIVMKEAIKADLLSNLGKVGEKAFKYIIGLENLKIYPNQDPYNFEMLWKKINSLKDFAKKHGIYENDIRLIKLLNYQDDNNQKSHNFDYWFSVIDLIMPEISNKFKEFMEYNIKSKMLIEYCKVNNEFWYKYDNKYDDYEEISLPFRAAIFPCLLDISFDYLPSIPKTQVKCIINSQRDAIKQSGDIFTRLRYASNNQEKKKFDIDEIYNIIKNITIFIEFIHNNNNSLDFDLTKSFAKYKSLEVKQCLKISEEEINNLFNLDLTGKECASTLYEPNYSYNSLKKLIDLGVAKNDLRKVIREGLHARTIKFFYGLGITDYHQIRKYLDYYFDKGDYPYEIKKLQKKLHNNKK